MNTTATHRQQLIATLTLLGWEPRLTRGGKVAAIVNGGLNAYIEIENQRWPVLHPLEGSHSPWVVHTVSDKTKNVAADGYLPRMGWIAFSCMHLEHLLKIVQS